MPAERARGDGESEIFPRIDIQDLLLQQIVFTEEDQTSGEGYTFVAIHEGVVAAQVKKISCGDFDWLR